jgi:predicted nucleic acid-binding protein
VLIDTSRGVSEAVDCLQQIERNLPLAISVITQMELFIGCRDKAELHTVESFLSRFQIIRLNEHISDIAVDLLRRYRLSHGLLIADALIAATAIYLGEPFVSKNQRDYRFITNLDLLPYPEPFPEKN